MARKRLTKTQIRKKLYIANQKIYDLVKDKLQWGGTSNIPMSEKMLLDINKKLVNAWNRTHK